MNTKFDITLIFTVSLIASCIADLPASLPDEPDAGIAKDVSLKDKTSDEGSADVANHKDLSDDVSDIKDMGNDVPTTKSCNNGKLDEQEICEGLEVRDNTCLTEGFSGGKISCTDKCALDTSHCYKCGDNTINPKELCDGTDFGGKTCSSELGVDSNGTLSCTESCTNIDRKNCIPKYVQVVSGRAHACGLKSDGKVKCWGSNNKGQTMFSSGSKYKSIFSGSDYVCGINLSNRLECWGSLISATNQENTPPNGTFRDIAISGLYACGVKTSGQIECWGKSNATSIYTNTPTGLFSKVVASGIVHVCGVKSDGRLKCWGEAARNPGAIKYKKISINSKNDCGIKKDSTLFCSLGGTSLAGKFIDLDLTNDLLIFGVTKQHGCAVRLNNEAVCWGENEKKQGDVPNGSKFSQISTGWEFTCGLKTDGTIKCWGDSSDGKLNVPQ